MKTSGFKTLLLCGAGCIAPFSSALAQSELAEAEDANVIIVTTQNRSQDMQDYRDSRQTAFTQTDLSLTNAPENKRFSLQGFVRNIENNRPLTYAGFTVAGPDDIYNWQFAAPRTYGVRLSVDF